MPVLEKLPKLLILGLRALIPWKGNASVSKWLFSTQGTSTFEVKKIDQIEYRARCDVMAYTVTNSLKSADIGI